MTWPGEQHRVWGVESGTAGQMQDGARPLVSDDRDLRRWGNAQVHHYSAIYDAGLVGEPSDPAWDDAEYGAWACGRDERLRLAAEAREARVAQALARARQVGLDGWEPRPEWGPRMIEAWREGRWERNRERQERAWQASCRALRRFAAWAWANRTRKVRRRKRRSR